MQNLDAIVPLPRLRAALGSLVAVAKRATLPDAPVLRTSLAVPLVAISYYAGSVVGFLLTPSSTPISTFWPANAILLSAFLLTPLRSWWVLLLTLFPVHLLIQLPNGIPVFSAVGWFFGNTGEALLGALCIRLLKKNSPLFESVRGTFIFLAFGVLVAPVAASFLDSASAIRIGEVKSYWLLWETRLSTNMVAVLSIVPIIVTLRVRGISWFRSATPARLLEGGALAACVTTASFLIFGGTVPWARINAAFIYVPLLLLCWAAVRFGALGLSGSILTVALVAGVNAVRGLGPFGASSIAEDIMSLHILLTVFAFPLMLIVALVAERQKEGRAIETTRRTLIHAHEEDLHRIARELHTYMAGQLTLVGLALEKARSTSSAYARPVLEKIWDQVSAAGSTVLRLTHKIHPFNVEYLGLRRALTKLCREAGTEGGINISSFVDNLPPELSIGVSLRLFRIAQLALETILERGAESASLECMAKPRRVVLRITEIGASGNLQPDCENVGLVYMREQALSLGGTFEIIAASPNVMVIEATIPTLSVLSSF